MSPDNPITATCMKKAEKKLMDIATRQMPHIITGTHANRLDTIKRKGMSMRTPLIKQKYRSTRRKRKRRMNANSCLPTIAAKAEIITMTDSKTFHEQRFPKMKDHFKRQTRSATSNA
mmetsp:Transcript_116303/g.226254  ORF Transcript_116303/g.226254 Transcript_116303/m.226254 type:complete len:117 (+) Transcript_116303:743-1093(+)